MYLYQPAPPAHSGGAVLPGRLSATTLTDLPTAAHGMEHQPRIVRLRVCDLRILSNHTPCAADAPEVTAAPDRDASARYFPLDGLYVVLRCGTQVRRTAYLPRCESRSTRPDEDGGGGAGVVDTFHTDLGKTSMSSGGDPPRPARRRWYRVYDDMDIDIDEAEAAEEAMGDGLGGPGTHREARQGCLVWDELFVFPLPTVSGRGDGAALPHDARGTEGLDGYPYGPLPNSSGRHPRIDLELWRSTPTDERCLGHHTYDVSAALARAWTRGGSAAVPPGLPPLAPPPGFVVDTMVRLHGAGEAAVRLGLRLRVASEGVALPPAPLLPHPGGVGRPAAMAWGYGGAGLLGGGPRYEAVYGGPTALDPLLARLLTPMGLGPSRRGLEGPPALHMPPTTATLDGDGGAGILSDGALGGFGMAAYAPSPHVRLDGGRGVGGILDGGGDGGVGEAAGPPPFGYYPPPK